MFEKILIANRGARTAGAGARSHAKHVMRAPIRLAREACGDLTAESTNV
jgi:hypothetical protein